MVTIIRLVEDEPGTVAQLLLRPTLMLLVWLSRRQPVWSAGQEISSVLPVTTIVRLVRVVENEEDDTLMVPSTDSIEVSQFRPGSRAGRVVLAKLPLRVVQSNRLNVSPSCSVAPTLLTTSAPP